MCKTEYIVYLWLESKVPYIIVAFTSPAIVAISALTNAEIMFAIPQLLLMIIVIFCGLRPSKIIVDEWHSNLTIAPGTYVFSKINTAIIGTLIAYFLQIVYLLVQFFVQNSK